MTHLTILVPTEQHDALTVEAQRRGLSAGNELKRRVLEDAAAHLARPLTLEAPPEQVNTLG